MNRANRADARGVAGLYSPLAAVFPLLFVLCAPGCGLAKVPSRLVETMPREASIDIFDAENQVSIALEGIDKAFREIDEIDLGIRKARAKRAAVSEGARPVWDARLQFLASERERAKLNVKLRELLLVVSRAQVEMVKAKVVDRYSLKAGGGFNVEKFEDQHEKWRKKATTLNKDVEALAKRSRALNDAWKKIRDAHTSKTGDFASVEVD